MMNNRVNIAKTHVKMRPKPKQDRSTARKPKRTLNLQGLSVFLV